MKLALTAILALCIGLAGATTIAIAQDIDAAPAAAETADASPDAPSEDSAAPSDPSQPDPGDIADNASAFAKAARGGKWGVALGFALLVIAGAARKLISLSGAARRWAESKLGGKILGAGTAFATVMGLALGSGAKLSVDTVLTGVLFAGAAAGFWSLAPDAWKKAVRPKAPA